MAWSASDQNPMPGGGPGYATRLNDASHGTSAVALYRGPGSVNAQRYGSAAASSGTTAATRINNVANQAPARPINVVPQAPLRQTAPPPGTVPATASPPPVTGPDFSVTDPGPTFTLPTLTPTQALTSTTPDVIQNLPYLSGGSDPRYTPQPAQPVAVPGPAQVMPQGDPWATAYGNQLPAPPPGPTQATLAGNPQGRAVSPAPGIPTPTLRPDPAALQADRQQMALGSAINRSTGGSRQSVVQPPSLPRSLPPTPASNIPYAGFRPTPSTPATNQPYSGFRQAPSTPAVNKPYEGFTPPSDTRSYPATTRGPGVAPAPAQAQTPLSLAEALRARTGNPVTETLPTTRPPAAALPGYPATARGPAVAPPMTTPYPATARGPAVAPPMPARPAPFSLATPDIKPSPGTHQTLVQALEALKGAARQPASTPYAPMVRGRQEYPGRLPAAPPQPVARGLAPERAPGSAEVIQQRLREAEAAGLIQRPPPPSTANLVGGPRQQSETNFARQGQGSYMTDERRGVAGRPGAQGSVGSPGPQGATTSRGGPRGDPLPHHTPITMPDGTILGGPPGARAAPAVRPSPTYTQRLIATDALRKALTTQQGGRPGAQGSAGPPGLPGATNIEDQRPNRVDTIQRQMMNPEAQGMNFGGPFYSGYPAMQPYLTQQEPLGENVWQSRNIRPNSVPANVQVPRVPTSDVTIGPGINIGPVYTSSNGIVFRRVEQ